MTAVTYCPSRCSAHRSPSASSSSRCCCCCHCYGRPVVAVGGWTLPLFITTLFLLTTGLDAKEVVLLDSINQTILNWKSFPPVSQSGSQGWVEETYTNFEKGLHWRTFVVCNVVNDKVNNWLWIPFIERNEAERIFIDLSFSIRDCSQFPGQALTCKETFSLLYYEFDAETDEPPPWEHQRYTLIDSISADKGRSSSTKDGVINVEKRSIEVNKKGVYFAIRDQGACISLIAVRVYYIVCPDVVHDLVRFPATPTARELSGVKRVPGACVENAVRRMTSSPSFCLSNGKWEHSDNADCVCKAGYEPAWSGQSCRACQTFHFKSDIGNESCGRCPAHSAAPYTASVLCRCDVGYFRSHTDPPSAPCTKPPSPVESLRVSHVDQSSAVLEWSAPIDLGGRNDTLYSVHCHQCPADVTFSPAKSNLSVTSVSVSGLGPASTYTLSVHSENGVSSLAPDTRATDRRVRVTTLVSVPYNIGRVAVKSVQATSVTLLWVPPVVPPGVRLLNYQVQYFERHRHTPPASAAAASASTGDISSHVTGRLASGGGGGGDNGTQLVDGVSASQLTIGQLKVNTEYGFTVRAHTSTGWGQPSHTVFATTQSHTAGSVVSGEAVREVNVRMIAGSVVAVIALLIIVFIMAVMFVRSRSNKDCGKKEPSDCDTLEYRNPDVRHPANGSVVRTHTGNMSTALYSATMQRRTYIDPHTYEDPNQMIREFVREIDASHIFIEAVIGGGEFGDVCRGKLRIPGRPEMTVAIKTLKLGLSEKARVDFLTEASIMGQFEHPSVIFLQGVVTHTNPVMIVTEFMENGSLDTFLRANDGKFQVLQLVAMLRDIAAGMQYLSEMSYVHRDLAARNVLVNTLLVCKIADFGLSREIEGSGEGAYTTRGGKIPVRWTAPEAIAFRKFTSASDVWSFGVVCWEVMSYGERPYWNWSNQDVIKSIEKGYRLPAPMDCPEAMHQLMLDCWQRERTHRPVFCSVVKTLHTLIACPETLRKVATNRSINPLSPDAPDLTRLASVDEWLASIKMSRYVENLRRAGVNSMEAVSRLEAANLPALGITLLGHQKKIINSVQVLRTQLRASLCQAYFV